MIVIDIGNTNIVLGVYFKKKLIRKKRFETKSKKLLTEINKLFTKNFFLYSKFDYNECIISSVVPSITPVFIKIFKKNKFKHTIVRHSSQFLNIKLNIKNQKELGTDRIVNSIASLDLYGSDCIIVDFGTATTFDVIKKNIYIGGIIAPGIISSHDSLVKNAALLKKIEILKSNIVIGKNTEQAMKSGFYWGYISLINGIISKILSKKKFKPKLILTGGLAKIFKNNIKQKYIYMPDLTLHGLYLIGIKKNDR